MIGIKVWEDRKQCFFMKKGGKMKVIIAEKPKLGRTVAHALRCDDKKEGYIEGENYIVTWGFGHLFSLKNIQDYDGLQGIPWDKISLPYFPLEFELKFTPDKEGKEGEIEKQFNIIKDLVNREDVNEIIHCGDADREGQVIVDEILQQIGNKKPVTRLWLPEQTEETIRQQIIACENNNEYLHLYNEGLARSYIDWLLGINLTVYLSNKAGTTIRVGRVLIPIIKYIYDRDQMIARFIPEKYFQVEGKSEKEGIPISLIAKKRYLTKEEAMSICKEWNQEKAKVVSIEKKEIKKFPKNLFSLTKLQEELSARHKMDFTTSLNVVQKLYEEGYVTYPRTNTQYLAENEKEKIKVLIQKINETGYECEMKDSKSIFDSSKVESHSALTPTTKFPEKLSSQEEIVYRVIFNRFVSNFLKEDTMVSETTLVIQVKEQEFKLKGTEIISQGFYQYEPKSFKNQLPNLLEGEEFIVEFTPVEKITSPPKKVSETELSKFLENPFKKRNILEETEEEEEEENISDEEDYKALLEGIEIGTVATRTGIIENAKSYNYITKNNSYFSITSFGEKVIQLLDDLEVNLYKEKNIEFSQTLKKIYHGMMTIEEALSETWNTLSEIVEKNLSSSVNFLETIGKCPKCGKEILEKPSYYGCSSCDFKLWKKAKYFKNSFTITATEAQKFLNSEIVECEVLSEEGKKSKKKLKMVLRDPYVNFEEEREIIGICPKCGGDIWEGNKNYYCTRYREGCNFVLWKEAKHFKDTLKITKAVAKKLLKKDGKSTFEVTRKDGKKKVDLKIKLNGNYVNFEEVK